MSSVSQPLQIQPKFAEQIQTLPSPLGVQVGGAQGFQRGYMIWAQKNFLGYTGGELGDGRDMIHFLFNPSTVSTDYNVGNASLQAAMMYQVPGDQGNLLAPLLMQTVSWELYFDRTFELNYGGPSSAKNDPAVIGVQADVYQFMQFTGVLATLDRQQAQAVLGSAGGQSASGTQAATTGGIMMMIPCYVFFGNALAQMNTNPNSANFAAVQNQMQFYGFISEWSVNYTHWTGNTGQATWCRSGLPCRSTSPCSRPRRQRRSRPCGRTSRRLVPSRTRCLSRTRRATSRRPRTPTSRHRRSDV